MNTEETSETTGILTEFHNSSIIETTSYHKNDSKLFVTFKTGATYEYVEFKDSDYEEFMNAESKGVHFGRVIRKNFTATKVEDYVINNLK